MSEADGKVRIEYEIEGIDEATAKQRSLEESLDSGSAALGRSTEALQEAKEATDEAAASTENLTANAVEAGFKLGEQREKISSLVGALGTLSSMLGTESDAGALVGRMAQFGQMGMQVGGIFGPTGAVVGGIAGSLVPALQELHSELTGEAEALRDAAVASGEYALATQNAARAARALASSRLEASSQQALINDADGIRLASEEAIFTARAQAREQARIFDERAAGARETAADRGPATLERIERGIATGRARMLAEIARLDGEIERRRQSAADESAFGGGVSVASGATDAPSARRGGGGGGGPRAAEDALSRQRVAGASLFADLQREMGANELTRIEQARQAEADALEARSQAERQAANDRWESIAKEQQERDRITAESMEREESKRLAIKRRQEADTRMWRGTQESMLDATLGGANAIGGAFANAFGAAIQGQEDFGAAFVKGMKMQLIQFGVGQVAEGAGALLSAVGLAFTNPPAAAGKAVEGAGKIALGVSLGAAGAAISTPSAPSAEDKAPRMGPSANEGASGANIVVNMNSPFVTAGTRAELGRSMTRTIGDSARRFGRAA